MNNMAKQMDMFEEGGLMDEGGTVDPVSGNDVPPGSTQEEVRDDIPAQLSEGEFVFPADVVRYFGLEKLMEMRQEAKMGLQRMEDMGQMGNSEEAIMPDNLPFSIEDLDTEDEGEYNTPQEFAYGGIVQMSGTNYTTTPNPGPTTGFRPYVAPTIPGYTPQPIQAGPQYQGIQLPGTQFIGATQKTNIPTFTQTIGTNPGQYDEFRTYVNSSGQTLRIPFKNGQPLYPIPQGYTLQKEDAVKTESTVPTTTVGQDGDDTSGDGDSGGLSSTVETTTSLGTKTATDKEHEAAFGGNVNAMSHKGYSKAVATLGMNQLGTLGTSGLVQQMSNSFAGTNIGQSLGVPTFDTFNDVGIAMNQGRNMALSALGLGNMGQVTTNAQYDAITAAMVAAKESPARYGLAVSQALTEHQEAIKAGQVAAMEGMGFKSTDLSNPDAVEQARAFYDIDVGTINTEIDSVTKAGTVRDDRGNPINTESGVVMSEKARQELEQLNRTKQELEAKKTSLDIAAANDPQEGLPSGVPSSPADFGALSPEDIANARASTLESAARQDVKTAAVNRAEAAKTSAVRQATPTASSDDRIAQTANALMAKGMTATDALNAASRVETTGRIDTDTASAFSRTPTATKASFSSGDSGRDEDSSRDEGSGPTGVGVGRGEDSPSAARDASRATGVSVGRGEDSPTAARDAAKASSGGGGGGDDKIVCTAMNNAYGFGSFRQTVWLQHSKSMDPAYQKGYHRIFKPLIKFAYKDNAWYNMFVRGTLEGIARRRTADIWMQKHGKRHLRGAIERTILEPLCYIVGKIK